MRFTYTKVEGFEPAIIGVRLNMSKDYEDAVSKMDSKTEVIRENHYGPFGYFTEHLTEQLGPVYVSSSHFVELSKHIPFISQSPGQLAQESSQVSP